jgi:urea carboxylase
VSGDELLDMRAANAAGELAVGIEETTFRLADHVRRLTDAADEIAAFRHRQQTAFATERQAWTDAGEFERASA